MGRPKAAKSSVCLKNLKRPVEQGRERAVEGGAEETARGQVIERSMGLGLYSKQGEG